LRRSELVMQHENPQRDMTRRSLVSAAAHAKRIGRKELGEKNWRKRKGPVIADRAFRFGGAKRDRTADLYNAIVALSQLSYGPETWVRSALFCFAERDRRAAARWAENIGAALSSVQRKNGPRRRWENPARPTACAGPGQF
jgi:hypothetical protein